MYIKPTRFEEKLVILERKRRDTEDKLDRSYLQNNVSELIDLEDRYETIMRKISKIKNLLENQILIGTI